MEILHKKFFVGIYFCDFARYYVFHHFHKKAATGNLLPAIYIPRMPIALLVQPHTSNFLKALHECPQKMGIKFLKISIHLHVPYYPGGGGWVLPKIFAGGVQLIS